MLAESGRRRCVSIFCNDDVIVGDSSELELVLLRGHGVNVVQVEADVLQVVLHLSVTDAAEEVLGVDLALAVLGLVVVEGQAVDFDDVFTNMAFL